VNYTGAKERSFFFLSSKERKLNRAFLKNAAYLTGVLSEWQWQRRLAEFLSQQMVAGGGKFHITNDSKLDIKLTANLNTKLSTGRETQCTRRKDTFAFSQ